MQVQVTGPSSLELALADVLVLRGLAPVEAARLMEVRAAARKATD